MSTVDVAALRELAAAFAMAAPDAWPRREIDHEGTCDGCGKTGLVIAAYDDPDGNSEPWLCSECALEVDYADAANPTVVLALLDRLEAAEGAVERVRQVCAEWDAEPNLPPAAYDAIDDVRAALDGAQP